MNHRPFIFAITVALAGCSGASSIAHIAAVSSTLALTSDDRALWVVAPDADSVSVIDPDRRTLAFEIPLAAGGGAPVVDPATGRFDPTVSPRALAILPGDEKVYVAAQRSNEVLVIDARRHVVSARISVGAEPTAVVAAPDGSAVYAVCHQAATVFRIDPRTDRVVGQLSVPEHPFGASISADGATLYVTHLLLHTGVTRIATAGFTVTDTVELAETAPSPLGKLVPNGTPRGVYQAVPRPGSGELWMPHLLLAVKTAQPDLDFDSTVFPTISTLAAGAKEDTAEGRRLLFQPMMAGVSGAFSDVISGPRALAFTPDGKLGLLADSGSEDVMVFDAAAGTESELVRPLPSTMLDGIVIDHAGRRAWVNGRNSHDVTALSIAGGPNTGASVAVDGDPIDLLGTDPMPANLRLGQRLFYTANSSVYPVTKDFWVSCSSCHLEGGTDAVTWRFVQGPRDTPSNAGGPINTGFLMRQALRNSVVDYDVTFQTEQGGIIHRDIASQAPLLDALADYVNLAIPFSRNPNLAEGAALDAAQARGKKTFDGSCASCHAGAFFTDSGAGNPKLDMSGPVLLHDIGTCVTGGAFDDQPKADEVSGKMREACQFDTPTLRGIFATAPYFHDGSAATLDEVVQRLPFSAALSDVDRADLVAYLKTL